MTDTAWELIVQLAAGGAVLATGLALVGGARHGAAHGSLPYVIDKDVATSARKHALALRYALLATGLVLIAVGTWFLLSIAGTPHQSASASPPAAKTLAPMSGRPALPSSALPVSPDGVAPLARGGEHFPTKRDGPLGQAEAPRPATRGKTGNQTYESARALRNDPAADRQAFTADAPRAGGTHRAPSRRLAEESTSRHQPVDPHEATSNSSRPAVVESQRGDRTGRTCACGAVNRNRMHDQAMAETAAAAAKTAPPATATPVQ